MYFTKAFKYTIIVFYLCTYKFPRPNRFSKDEIRLTIDLNQLQRDIWPLGTPDAAPRTAELYDYALGGLELATIELDRQATIALARSKQLLKIALHPELYDFTTE
jgi:hypothetical protein